MHAWAEVSIYHRAASLSSQASSVDVCSVGWWIINQTRLSSNTPCTPRVPSNTAILCNNYISLLSDCVHVYTWRKWHRKWSHSSSVTGSNCLLRLQSCKKSDELVHCSAENAVVLCENHRESVTQIWTSTSEERKKENIFFIWQLSGLVFSWRFFCATRSLVGHENTWIWIVCCYKSFQILLFWDFERFYCIILYCVFMLSLHVKSTDSLITDHMHAFTNMFTLVHTQLSWQACSNNNEYNNIYTGMRWGGLC